MNLIVKLAETASRGPKMAAGVNQPTTRAFMDDLTITAKTVIEGRWMLEDPEKLVLWARMKFKPAKSHSLVLKRGKKVYIQDQGKMIPTVSIGKLFDSTLSDKQCIKDLEDQQDKIIVPTASI
jgi:hypothetical protein